VFRVPKNWVDSALKDGGARYLSLVLSALVSLKGGDVAVRFISEDDTPASQLSGASAVQDCCNLPPLSYNVEEADSGWEAWAKVVGLSGAQLLEYARSVNLAAPADDDARTVYASLVTKLKEVLSGLRQKVTDLHPHPKLVHWPLSTRSQGNARSTQLSLATLLLCLQLRNLSDSLRLTVAAPAADQVRMREPEPEAAAPPQAAAVAVAKSPAAALRSAASGRFFATMRANPVWNDDPSMRYVSDWAFKRIVPCARRVLEANPDAGPAAVVNALEEDWEREQSAQPQIPFARIICSVDLGAPILAFFSSMRETDGRPDGELKRRKIRNDDDDEDAEAEAMDIDEDEVTTFKIEVTSEGLEGEFSVIELTRALSSRDSPDTQLLDELRRLVTEKWSLVSAVAESGTFRSRAPSFLVKKKFFWDTQQPLQIVFEPLSLAKYETVVSIGTSVSYGSRFCVFNAQSLHDVWRRAVASVKPSEQVLERLAHLIRDACEGKIDLPGKQRLASLLKPERGFVPQRDGQADTQPDETRLAILLCSTSHLPALQKACSQDFSFGAFQTNKTECRLILNCHHQDFESKSSGARARANEKDQFAADVIASKNNKLCEELEEEGFEVKDAGVGAFDEGMKGVDFNRVTPKEAQAMAKARKYVLDCEAKGEEPNLQRIAKLLELEERGGVLHFKKQTAHFSLTVGQVECEARTKCHEKKIDEARKQFHSELSERDAARLTAAGGLCGDKKLAKVPLAEIADHVETKVVPALDLRTRHYRHAAYREQRFSKRRAVESLAARVFDVVQEVASDAAKQETAWSRTRDSTDTGARVIPGKKTFRKGGRKEKAAAHAAYSGRMQEEEEGKEEEENTVFRFTLCPGDWNGRAPGRYNTPMPRKAFLRRLRRLVRDYASAQRARSTRMIIGWKPVNEYRSSVQTPQPLPLVLGRRVNRFNPPSRDKDTSDAFCNVANHRPWKLLWCPETHTLLQRDMSAAWAIALQHAFEKAARDLKLPEDERVLPGYKRAHKTNGPQPH
jgi:hypothetical protein